MPLIRTNFSSKRLKRLLLFIIFLTLFGIFRVFFTYQSRLNSQPPPEVPSESEPASLSLNQIHHTATRDGIRQWSLDAPSAHYIDEKHQAVVDKPSVVFFLKDQKQILLNADKGVLHTDSNNIELTGNISAAAENFLLQTEHLIYSFKAGTILSHKPVTISGQGLHLRADTLSFDLNNLNAVLNGHVKGNFDESIF
jgi:LPS export ABC transporter protein LptC